MNKRCIVSFATGRYTTVLDRLMASHTPFEDTIDLIYLKDRYPDGCPTHQEVPYAFKSFCIKDAIELGYTSILWMDSAVWIQHDVNKLFDIIEEKGYLILRNGWTQANWSTDAQLEAFNLTRDEAETMPHPMACVIGFHVNENTVDWIHDYINKYPLFVGAWNNSGNVCSQDMRCLGSRHDQTILGFIANQYGLEFTNTEGLISYDVNDSNSILLSQGI
jgi:hypothetical protein